MPEFTWGQGSCSRVRKTCNLWGIQYSTQRKHQSLETDLEPATVRASVAEKVKILTEVQSALPRVCARLHVINRDTTYQTDPK